MNYTKLINSVQEIANPAASGGTNPDTRAAVAQTPLDKGDIIAFPAKESECSRLVSVLGTPVRMLYGVRIDDANGTFDESREAVQLSALALGRVHRNPQTGTRITPETIAKDLDLDLANTKLVFTEIKDKTVGDIPAYVAGKKLKVAGLKREIALNAQGAPRLDANSQPIMQTIYCFVEV